MTELIIPPSPSWYLSSILACSDDGKTLAYGARHEIVLIQISENPDTQCGILPTFIPMAHKDRVTAVAFPPSSASNYSDNVVSSSDDGTVRVWNYTTQMLRYSHSGHPEGHKLPSLDWSRADPNLIVSVSDMGSIVCWDLLSNTIRRLFAGAKVLPVCVACSPHKKDIIAVGAKHGLVVVYNIKGDMEQLFRLRGHETDVVSLAFCPSPYNVFRDSKSEPVHLLMSGSKDRCVSFWKTGTDGRLEYSINLPQTPMSGQRNRNGTLVGAGNSWISVSWPSAYTVFSSSLYGELLAYDLKALVHPPKGSDAIKKKPKPVLVHGVHHKGLFSIAAAKCVENGDDILVWTSALDKHVVCAKYKDLKVLCNITTIGGIVYCIAASPLDPYRIAFGTGDNKIYVWNMSSPQSVGMQTYWSKINSKVMAIAWHPVHENLIAFGTGEGRVGLLDLSGGKQPTLLRLYHRKCVYSLLWAPPVVIPEGDVSKKKYALFSVGDGEIAQYDTETLDKEPESLGELLNDCDTASSMSKTLIRTDLAFNHDKSLAAIGNENGSVYVVGGQKFNYLHTIFAHKKLVQCLSWHPATVTSESCHSQYSSWLASASDNIQIVSITPTSVETVKSLGGHCEKVVSLMWSPHINGRLITASYDYTSQVWDVVQGTMITWLEGHHGPVVCCMFSPIHPDMAITGSADYTIRLWDLSKHSDLSINVSSKNKKQRMSGAKKRYEGAEEATDLNPQDGSEYKLVKSGSIETSGNDKKEKVEGEKMSVKRRQASMFPVTSLSMTSAKHIDLLWKRIQAKEQKKDTPCKENGEALEVTASEQNGHIQSSDSPTPSLENSCYLDFFGDDTAARRLLAVEETHHMASTNFQNAMHASLWTGEISDVIYESMKKKQLNDWLVSLAPLVSYRLWSECCTSYANQLMEKHTVEGQGMKAASYLLAVHKIEEAVDCLISCKLPREAVILAKCRLGPNDPAVVRAMNAFTSYCMQTGQHILAAHCLLSIGDRMGCVDLLSRSKDANILSLASDIATSIESKDLAASLAVRSITLSLAKHDFDTAECTLQHHPNLKELSLWVKICSLLKSETRLDDSSGAAWLLGSDAGKLKSSVFKDCVNLAKSLQPICYQSLSKHILSTPDYSSDSSVWLYISGQLSLSVICQLEEKIEDCLKHIIKVLNAAYIYQNYQPRNNKVFLQIAPFLFPQGPCLDDASLLQTIMAEDSQISSSISENLEAHLVCSGIFWIEYLLSKEHPSLIPPPESLQQVFTKASSTVLKMDVLLYFTNEVKIKNLEKQVAVGKLESLKSKTEDSDSTKKPTDFDLEPLTSSETATEDATNVTLEDTLDQLKSQKKTFETNWLCAVSPFVMYCCIKNVLQQILTNDEKGIYQLVFDNVVAKWESLNV